MPLAILLVKVTPNEVVHSIFYAPMCAAIEEGYFDEKEIELDLVCGFDADKAMTAVLSGEADIGFMAPETTVYTANEDTATRSSISRNEPGGQEISSSRAEISLISSGLTYMGKRFLGEAPVLYI